MCTALNNIVCVFNTHHEHYNQSINQSLSLSLSSCLLGKIIFGVSLSTEGKCLDGAKEGETLGKRGRGGEGEIGVEKSWVGWGKSQDSVVEELWWREKEGGVVVEGWKVTVEEFRGRVGGWDKNGGVEVGTGYVEAERGFFTGRLRAESVHAARWL